MKFINELDMNNPNTEEWERFKKWYQHYPEIGLSIDVSRMAFEDAQLENLESSMTSALTEMAELERGAIANRDEGRMVGHYWLRNPSLAPTSDITLAIGQTIEKIKRFAASVHAGSIRGAGGAFKNVLLIGIGGSALGPQFVSKALATPAKGRLRICFLDNTDPDGIDCLMSELDDSLSKTLVLVISKSGETKETRNGMLEVKARYEASNLSFEKHAVAITGEGSGLDKLAINASWLERFPMWEWVGGRTSELSPVGLLPAALQGIDIDGLLAGARSCDEVTRDINVRRNPAALMAAMWHLAGEGKGRKDMVVLPYKDRLELFSKYLQQLIMESLGKGTDRNGNAVSQGLAVYGNKGSTDQHAFVQQLRDGLNNFFVTFIEVQKDRDGNSILVENEFTSGDYLSGFYLGTRQALSERGRESISITIESVSSFSVGVLIALFERTVGLYASMVNVNAYHQPGVEAGKRAASRALAIQSKIVTYLRSNRGQSFSAEEIAAAINEINHSDVILKICLRASLNQRFGLKCIPNEIAAISQFTLI